MSQWLERTELLLGEEALNRLKNSSVLIFGVGGVGGYVAETLGRSGLGSITLVDGDSIAPSNINRQIIATRETLGRDKVEVMAERLRSINPEIRVLPIKLFYLPDTAESLDFRGFDYIVDAVDTVKAKIEIIERALEHGVPVISSMGCGNRTDPGKLKITRIEKTFMDPLAKVMRKELGKRGIKKIKVLCSEEKPLKPSGAEGIKLPEGKRSVPGSTAFVPPAAGLMIAREVVMDLIENKEGRIE